jgi:hypothetical protein
MVRPRVPAAPRPGLYGLSARPPTLGPFFLPLAMARNEKAANRGGLSQVTAVEVEQIEGQQVIAIGQ